MADSLTETSGRQVQQESLAMLSREVDRASDTMTDVPPISEYSVEGDPMHILPELAHRAAMLVVGRHQGGLVRQALLGSVSAACVRHATCPVVVIPSAVAAHEPANSAEPAVAAQD